MAEMVLEADAPVTVQEEQNGQEEAIARDLALMDKIEAFVQSLPNRRAAAGLGPLPNTAVAEVYEEREATAL